MFIADVLDKEGAELAAELKGSAIFQHHDVTDEASWSSVMAGSRRRLLARSTSGRHGESCMFKTLLDTSKADYERVLGVNLMGAFLGVKAVAPHMIERGSGSIVNVSSVDGIGVPWPRAPLAARQVW